MSYDAENETYERDFSNGAWVSGENNTGEAFTQGMITNFDDDDGQYYVIWPDERDPDIYPWHEAWCEHDALTATDGPNASPEHVFVVTDGENFRVYANPEAVLAEGNIADDPVNRRALMEAVADPGEAHLLTPGELSLTFEAVKGAER